MTKDAEEGIFRERASRPAILLFDCEKSLSFLMVNMIGISERDEKIGIKKVLHGISWVEGKRSSLPQ